MEVRTQKPHTVGQTVQRSKEKQIIENNSSCKTKTTKTRFEEGL